jgi:predicted RNase H-like HicB family nuclease
MTDYKFRVLIERDEDGYYIATVPELKGCHTQAKTLDQLMKRTQEAVELYLGYLKDKASAVGKMDFVGLQEIVVKA